MNDLFTILNSYFRNIQRSVPGHPPELSDSVKLLIIDAKRHVLEINLVLKSIL